MAPTKRGWLGALLDKLFARVNGLPSESCSYTMEKIQIPMEDGLKLEADLYLPIGTKPVGTLLVRSLYGIGMSLALGHARIFAARGYQVVFSRCRGSSNSDGNFNPGHSESADGHATVAWMREQPWYTGSFATLGGSYLGFVQWALLSNPPTDMKAAVIKTGPHDFGSFIWGTGALTSNAIAWADVLTRMRRGDSLISLLLSLRSQKSRLRPIIDSVPLLDAVDEYFAGNTPDFLRQTIIQSDRTDSFWNSGQHNDALEQANIPILLITGWYDLNQQATMEQYSKLSQRGCNVALIVGPWTHLSCQRNTINESFSWLEEHLAQRKNNFASSPVRIFVTGTQEWRNIPKWPPSTVSYELFLWPGKKLSSSTPPEDAPDSVFKFDPNNPTPAIGVPELFDNGDGRKNEDTALTTRSDVLVFTTEPLDRDLEVCGRPSIELHHSSNHPYVDLLILLSEIDTKGISRSIAENYVRLDANRSQDPLELALGNCAHNFRKGTTMRLLIAGGSHPRFIRNLGTGDNVGTGTTLRPAFHTVSHNASAISKLVLPQSMPS